MLFYILQGVFVLHFNDLWVTGKSIFWIYVQSSKTVFLEIKIFTLRGLTPTVRATYLLVKCLEERIIASYFTLIQQPIYHLSFWSVIPAFMRDEKCFSLHFRMIQKKVGKQSEIGRVPNEPFPYKYLYSKLYCTTKGCSDIFEQIYEGLFILHFTFYSILADWVVL